jgi:ribosome recycling factor
MVNILELYKQSNFQLKDVSIIRINHKSMVIVNPFVISRMFKSIYLAMKLCDENMLQH